MSRDNKLTKWNKIPKFEEREKFTIYSNMMISDADMDNFTRCNNFYKKVKDGGRIGKLKPCCSDNILNRTFMYGMPVSYLISDFEVYVKRCHSTVLALSLGLDRFTWVVGDLKMQGLADFITYIQHEEEYMVAEECAYARGHDEIVPTWTHSYLEVPGFELLAKGMISPESLSKGFKCQPEKTYVLDCLWNMIIEKDLYQTIMQPNHFQTFSSKEIKETEIWKVLDSQKNLKLGTDYSVRDYCKFYATAILDRATPAGEFLSDVVFTDYEILSKRRQKSSGALVMPHIAQYEERMLEFEKKMQRETEKAETKTEVAHNL